MGDVYRTGAYADRNPDWHDSDAEVKAQGIADLIRFSGLKPRTVVDVGCGTGGVLLHLRRMLGDELGQPHWEGWDVASPAIRRARAHEGGDLHFVSGDFLASERKVDLVLCVDVVEHVDDDLAFLRALTRHARWFVFRIPLDLSAWDVVRPKRLLNARQQFGHRHLYTREVALQLLDDAGYTVRTTRYHRVPPPRRTLRQRVVDRLRRSAVASAPDLAVRVLGGFSLLVLAAGPAPRVGESDDSVEATEEQP
ncbi:MAG: methyltransferase domain-containing protein [Myxococcales bacterium]|nr:methyltransferase domain-containing protein [Myxococcales bacterium]